MQGDTHNILIADDDPAIQRLLKDFLEGLGYKVTSAMDGDTAIMELQKNHYDLLISDVIMPGTDGIALIKIIRGMGRYHNLPIIMLSGKSNTPTKVAAFESLADDYVTKPFDFDEIGSRVKTQLRLKQLQENLEEKNRLLLYRNLELEAHLEVAKHIQQQLLPLDVKEIYGIRISSIYKPVDKVGGDIFDLLPFVNGKIGIFIGDVSGHGVPSAFLNIVLRMLIHSIAREEAVSPSRMLEKINNAIMPYLSEEDFITASYGIIDVNHRVLYSASAGHPKAIIFRGKENRTIFMNGSGPCLGILEGVAYETHPVRLLAGDRLIYYTDGLIEAKSPGGKMLGTEGLCRMIEGSVEANGPGDIAAGIASRIEKFAGVDSYEDDLTVLCLEIEDAFYYSWYTKYINIQAAIDILLKPLTSEKRIDLKDIKKVRVALHEALSNAIEHGNLQIPASLKEGGCVEDLFERLKGERMANAVYASRKITAGYIKHDNDITYCIKDEGPGFDYKNVYDPTSPDNILKCYGRGIVLMRICMDEVSFNEKGNEIRLVKNFPVQVLT